MSVTWEPRFVVGLGVRVGCGHAHKSEMAARKCAARILRQVATEITGLNSRKVVGEDIADLVEDLAAGSFGYQGIQKSVWVSEK